MASTAHKTEEEKKEYFDSPEELDKKITILAKIIKESEHFIALQVQEYQRRLESLIFEAELIQY